MEDSGEGREFLLENAVSSFIVNSSEAKDLCLAAIERFFASLRIKTVEVRR
jgi:hypothetical protein